MINDEELPIGLTMELAMHADTLNRFSRLPRAEQQAYIDGARMIGSREEMRGYVEHMFHNEDTFS